jgi:formylmethanofuran dehydrogenase subunit E
MTRDQFLKRLAKDVLELRNRVPICPRCNKPFKKWRHSRVDSAPICEPCFEEGR